MQLRICGAAGLTRCAEPIFQHRRPIVGQAAVISSSAAAPHADVLISPRRASQSGRGADSERRPRTPAAALFLRASSAADQFRRGCAPDCSGALTWPREAASCACGWRDARTGCPQYRCVSAGRNAATCAASGRRRTPRGREQLCQALWASAEPWEIGKACLGECERSRPARAPCGWPPVRYDSRLPRLRADEVTATFPPCAVAWLCGGTASTAPHREQGRAWFCRRRRLVSRMGRGKARKTAGARQLAGPRPPQPPPRAQLPYRPRHCILTRPLAPSRALPSTTSPFCPPLPAVGCCLPSALSRPLNRGAHPRPPAPHPLASLMLRHLPASGAARLRCFFDTGSPDLADGNPHRGMHSRSAISRTLPSSTQHSPPTVRPAPAASILTSTRRK